MINFLKKIKDEKGQAVVEFAITLPMLLLIVCGIIDFGWLYFNKLSVSNYCREAARYAIVSYNGGTEEQFAAQIKNRVNQIVPSNFVNKINVTVDFSNNSTPKAGDVTIDLTSMVPSLTYITRPISVDGEIKVESKLRVRMQ